MSGNEKSRDTGTRSAYNSFKTCPRKKETSVNEQPNARKMEDLGSPNPAVEETLVADPRGEWTPSQIVEHKLATMLRATPLPVSMVHSDRYTGR
jgi:hypothetical protein